MMLSLFLATALAADQQLVYELTVNGQHVGTRTVGITYLDRSGSQRRIIETYTDMKVGSNAWTVRSTSTSTQTSASFTTSVDANGALSQVQGVEQPGGGWRIAYIDRQGLRDFTVSRTEARLSSMDLFDPGRVDFLDTQGPFGLVLAETGEVVAGTMGTPSSSSVTVAGTSLPVTHYTLTSQAGNASFDVDENGILVRSEVLWMGMRVVSVLKAPPPLREMGEIQSFEGIQSTIKAEDL